MAALAAQRDRCLRGGPDGLIRGARHYESAAQILIRHATMTARQFISLTQPAPGSLPPASTWFIAETAARIDLAGGWSDTPPITYEHGGAVVNAAITIDGARPIGAKVRRIERPVLVLVMDQQRLELTELEQLANYTQPQSPGALLKAAFCCCEIVSLESPLTLAEQLQQRFRGGALVRVPVTTEHGVLEQAAGERAEKLGRRRQDRCSGRGRRRI